MSEQISRRVFLRVAGGTTAALSACAGAVASISPTAVGPIPPDKGFTRAELNALRRRGRRRVYRGADRFAIGMPVGGICAGQVYLLGDGTLGGWKIDGRRYFTGYGADCYDVRAPERNLAQGFALAIEGHTPRSAPLRDDDASPYDIEFVGEYPIAEVRYLPTDDAWPSVTLEAYSPFIPLDAHASSHPCTVLRYTVTNTTGSRLRSRLVGHLENGVALDAGDRPLLRLENRTVREHALTGVLMSAGTDPQEEAGRPERTLADFESGDYDGWTVAGEAFGAEPAPGTHPRQQPVSGFQGERLANSFTDGDAPTGSLTSEPFTIDRKYLTFLVGGGAHEGRTCVNLLVGDEIVRTATGTNNERLDPRVWDVTDLQGREGVIEILDDATGPWGHVNADRFALTDVLPASLAGADPEGESWGTMGIFVVGAGEAAAQPDADDAEQRLDRLPPDPAPESLGPRLPGLVAADLDLAPGQSTERVFILSWHFPNLHTGHGREYATRFDDALDVARHAAHDDATLRDQTRLFRDTYYEDTNLPWWLALRLMMSTANLATGTAQWWANGRFWGWEGVGCCHGTCTHVWNYAHAHARLFPELARSARTMQDLGTAFDEQTGRVAFRGDADAGFAYAADGQAGTVLKCYREHLCAPDDAFLRASWPRIRQALEYLIKRDAEIGAADPDGMIEGSQHNTYDINFVGPNTFVGSLYVAALHAGAAMADRVGAPADAARYRGLARAGRAFAEQRLFNGDYFVQKLPPDADDRHQYAEGCLSDQLFGETWSRLLGLGPVYDPAKARTALASVYRHNWTPAVGQYSAEFPPERVFARDREGGLFICTWPRRGRPDEPVRYRDEVWTGIEYEAATAMAWHGLLDQALTIVKAIDDRYDGRAHNPWNEVECGDHYARAMAAWGVYQAICGLHYDGPRAAIGMAPRLTPEDFAAFFTGARGWGLIRQRRPDAGTQRNEIEVRSGELEVASVGAALPGDPPVGRVEAAARVGDRTLDVRATRRAELWWADLPERFVLRAGQSLTVDWSV